MGCCFRGWRCADSSMPKQPREVEQGSMERRLKAPGPAGAGSSVLEGSVHRDFPPQVGRPHRGGATERLWWAGAPRRPRAERSKDFESGPGFTV